MAEIDPAALAPSPEIPDAFRPDPYADRDRILSLVKRRREEWGKGREQILLQDWLNLLYYRGHQWIFVDRTTRRIRPVTLPDPDMPRPVTNKFGETCDALSSVLGRVEPVLTFQPATDEPEDRAAAEVASRILEVCEAEVGIREQRQHLAPWVALTGGAWLETGYDPDPRWGMTQVQGAEVDPMTGQPIMVEAPVGRMYVDIVSKFEMYFDPAVTHWPKQKACLRVTTFSEDEAKARWPEYADRVKADSLPHEAEQYLNQLPTLGPGGEDSVTRRPFGMGITQPASRVTEQRFYQLPDEAFPDGLLAIVLGADTLVYAGPVPTTSLTATGERVPFLPFVWFPQKLVPGTAWPKSVADDLMRKQAQRNRYEAMIELTARTMGLPTWLVPQGANISAVSGRPLWIQYNPFTASGAVKPERIPGQNPSMAHMEFLAKIDQDMEALAGTFDVIKGARPAGVSAGIALQILQERGMSRFAPMFVLWEAAWAEWARQALEIFRQYATEPRLLQIQGRDGGWEVQKFSAADLRGRVNVKPEAASSTPRSSLVDRAEMEQLMALGILNPADPEVRQKILEVYGRTNLLPAMKQETKNAWRENEQWEALAADPRAAQPMDPMAIQQAVAMGQGPQLIGQMFAAQGMKLPQVKTGIDDDSTHIREHLKIARSERFETFPPLVQMAIQMHVANHRQNEAMMMQSMATARQGTFPTAGFLSNPGGQSSALNVGSSPARQQGDFREMERDAT